MQHDRTSQLFACIACGFFSLAVAQGSSAAPSGTIVGHVRYLGARVVGPVRVPSDSQSICGKTQASSALVIDKDKGLANAVLSIMGVPGSGPPAPVEVSIRQEACIFDPHVVAVPVGSRLVFVNTDMCLHNVHLISNGITVANIGMPLKGQQSKLPVSVLAKPGNVHFKCDVHPWMDGYVHVFNHPYFTVSDNSGAFRITGVPPGSYELQVQHELLGGSSRSVTVPAGEVVVEIDLK
jgi:plastocyanin